MVCKRRIKCFLLYNKMVKICKGKLDVPCGDTFPLENWTLA